jgi:protein-tyrosine phosphatase
LLFRVPLVDSAGNDPVRLKLAINTIAQLIAAGIPALVSCSAGMSRSPAIVAAALAKVENADMGETLLRVIADAPREVSPALWRDIVQLVASG